MSQRLPLEVAKLILEGCGFVDVLYAWEASSARSLLIHISLSLAALSEPMTLNVNKYAPAPFLTLSAYLVEHVPT